MRRGAAGLGRLGASEEPITIIETGGRSDWPPPVKV